MPRKNLGFTIMEVFSDKLEVSSIVGQMTKVVMVKTYNASRKSE